MISLPKCFLGLSHDYARQTVCYEPEGYHLYFIRHFCLFTHMFCMQYENKYIDIM